MLTFFRKNYNLSNIMARVLFVAAYVFSRWQSGLSATLLLLGKTNWLLAIASLLLIGVILMVLLPLVVDVLLGVARIYTVPKAEYNLLALIFCGLGFLLLGLLNLVNLFTPLLLTWGGILFPLVSTLAAAVGFYAVTSKLYFNDLTRAHYFKVLALFTLIFIVVFEVL